MNISFLGTGKIFQLVNSLCKHRDLTEFNPKYPCEKVTLIWHTLVITVQAEVYRWITWAFCTS